MNLNNYVDDLEALGYRYNGDLYKLVGLYAFHAVYDGVLDSVDETLAGITITANASFPMHGVYFNQKYDEDVIEVVTGLLPSSEGFEASDIINAAKSVCQTIFNIKKNIYSQGNLESEQKFKALVDEYKDESGKPLPIRITVITNGDVSEKKKYEISTKLAACKFSGEGFKITAEVQFGEDIESLIESDVAPFDFVKQGSLVVDKPNNYLTYGDNSIICNVSALSLKDLWKKEGKRGLLAMNLRYYVKSVAIDDKIADSIFYKPNEFWYYNNGIIIVCDDYHFEGNKIVMKNFSIVNGGQTTNRIGTIPFDKDFYLSCKVVKNCFVNDEDKNRFVADVAEASNSQKPINAKDRIANKVEQRNLKKALDEIDIFCEIKRGDKANKDRFKEVWQKTKNNQIAQDLYSFVFMEPGPARNSVSTILQNEEKYAVLFERHSYDTLFLKNLIFLEKAYLKYQKGVNKDENADAATRGVVKNGLLYALATIGYILKLAYSPAFRSTVLKYRNNEDLYRVHVEEQAFKMPFIADEMTFKEFVKDSDKLFNYVMMNLIVPCFKEAAASNESLAYSNWTKSNTGFWNITKKVNLHYFDLNEKADVTYVSGFFVPADEEMQESNDKIYNENIAKNIVIKAKASNGMEIKEEDKPLRDALMLLRFEHSQKTGKKDTKILSDKNLDAIVVNKPTDIESLTAIIGKTSAYYIGQEILKLVIDHINNL